MKTRFLVISFIFAVIAIFCPISNTLAENAPGIIDDIGFAKSEQEKFTASDWIESEKSLYRGLFKGTSYDILIVPLQVQAYAFNRANRSLITRNLSYLVENTTNLKLPDPTIVERALGERMRRFNDAEIYQLADELKVKYLIRSYAGHNLDEKLILTLLIQERDGTGILNSQTKVAQLDWKEIPFSDEYPPAEAFRGILNDIALKLPLPKTKKITTNVYKRVGLLPMPETILTTFKNKSMSPVVSAYYLQLLGILYPEDIGYRHTDDKVERENLFERSLVAINSISPESPDYAILKARAFFYLRSRPAALAALGMPNTPEEKAFLALLNGNLIEMEKSVENIVSPLHKLIANIELNDLRLKYNPDLQFYTQNNETYQKIAQEFPDWEMIILRRLQKSMWEEQSNLVIKKKLDETFPIAGFTAEDIIRSKMVLRESPFFNEDIDFSVYNHYHKFVDNQTQRFCCINGALNPVEMDYLNLLYAIGEANLWKRISLLIYGQELYQEAFELLNNYESIYRGNLNFTYLKIVALKTLSTSKGSQQVKNIYKNINELENNFCYWLQGQNYDTACSYKGDYPSYLGQVVADDRRILKKYSVIKNKPSDLHSLLSIPYLMSIPYLTRLELNLLYTHNDFQYLEKYHSTLIDMKMFEEADILWELNKERFIGNPRQATYFIQYAARKLGSDLESSVLNIVNAYRDAITKNPDVWESYSKLGKLYLTNGEFKKAYDVFNNYPLFKEKKANTVALSKYAGEAGIQFYRRGAIKEAKDFFKLSASYNTGSGNEMMSLGYLSLSKGDYKQAANQFLKLSTRYNNADGYALSMAILHSQGYHQEAWSLFNSYNQKPTTFILLSGLIGNRMEARTTEDRVKQFLEVNLQKTSPDDAITYFFLNSILDRYPDQKLSESLEKNYKQFALEKPQYSKAYSAPLIMFADGYYFMRNKDFRKAFNIFKELLETFENRFERFSYPFSYPRIWRYEDYSYVLPYFAIRRC